MSVPGCLNEAVFAPDYVVLPRFSIRFGIVVTAHESTSPSCAYFSVRGLRDMHWGVPLSAVHL